MSEDSSDDFGDFEDFEDNGPVNELEDGEILNEKDENNEVTIEKKINSEKENQESKNVDEIAQKNLLEGEELADVIINPELNKVVQIENEIDQIAKKENDVNEAVDKKPDFENYIFSGNTESENKLKSNDDLLNEVSSQQKPPNNTNLLDDMDYQPKTELSDEKDFQKINLDELDEKIEGNNHSIVNETNISKNQLDTPSNLLNDSKSDIELPNFEEKDLEETVSPPDNQNSLKAESEDKNSEKEKIEVNQVENKKQDKFEELKEDIERDLNNSTFEPEYLNQQPEMTKNFNENNAIDNESISSQTNENIEFKENEKTQPKDDSNKDSNSDFEDFEEVDDIRPSININKPPKEAPQEKNESIQHSNQELINNPSPIQQDTPENSDEDLFDDFEETPAKYTEIPKTDLTNPEIENKTIKKLQKEKAVNKLKASMKLNLAKVGGPIKNESAAVKSPQDDLKNSISKDLDSQDSDLFGDFEEEDDQAQEGSSQNLETKQQSITDLEIKELNCCLNELNDIFASEENLWEEPEPIKESQTRTSDLNDQIDLKRLSTLLVDRKDFSSNLDEITLPNQNKYTFTLNYLKFALIHVWASSPLNNL